MLARAASLPICMTPKHAIIFPRVLLVAVGRGVPRKCDERTKTRTREMWKLWLKKREFVLGLTLRSSILFATIRHFLENWYLGFTMQSMWLQGSMLCAPNGHDDGPSSFSFGIAESIRALCVSGQGGILRRPFEAKGADRGRDGNLQGHELLQVLVVQRQAHSGRLESTCKRPLRTCRTESDDALGWPSLRRS